MRTSVDTETRDRLARRRLAALRRDILGLFITARVEIQSGLPEGALTVPGKGDMAVSDARGKAGYILHTVCGLSLTKVGHCLRQHRSSVANAVARTKSDRDDPVLDGHLDQLERDVRPLLRLLDTLEETPL